MKSTLYPLADTLRKTVFSLKGNDGSEFTHNKSPSALFAHQQSSQFQVRSEILSRAGNFRLLLFLSATGDVTVPSFAEKHCIFFLLNSLGFISPIIQLFSKYMQHQMTAEKLGILMLQFKKRNDLFRGPGKNQTHFKPYFHIVLVEFRYINYSMAIY